MRTCWIVCKPPAENRLALSCRGHKSKGWRTKHCTYKKNHNTTTTPPPPPKYIIPRSDNLLPRVTITSRQSLWGKQCSDWWADRRVTMTTQRPADDSMESETERESEVRSPAGCHRAPRCLYVLEFSFKRIISSFQQLLIRLIGPNGRC